MEDTSAFKKEFKYLKRKCPPPDYERVLDMTKLGRIEERADIKPREVTKHQPCGAEELFATSLMRPPSNWEIYELAEKPGFLFLKNPFTSIGQRYWIGRCLRDYTRKPNLLNLDAHNESKMLDDWWDSCQRKDKNTKALQKKLRWATMGYHHNWNTKVYSDNAKDPFPSDLAALSRYMARVVGFQEEFKAEAAIVNFYHFDSTLSGHRDHSEADMTAPLFSFSFGQTAIFLLGGPDPEDKPTPVFINSGDVVIMSGYSRLCYHGIPKIISSVKTPWEVNEFGAEKCIDDSSNSMKALFTCKDSSASKDKTMGPKLETHSQGQESDELMIPKKKIKEDRSQDRGGFDNYLLMNLQNETFWRPFQEYIERSRINMNVRQVLPKGQTTLACALGNKDT